MSTTEPTRADWLTERRKGIGASDSPSILGVSPFKTEFQVWSEKTGLCEDDLSDNEAVEFGLRLERPIAEAYANRRDRNVRMWPQHTVVRDPERPWLCCTPDAEQIELDDREDGLLQIKTTSAFSASEWSEGPPLYYQVQCQHELAVTGYEWSTLVVLIGGQKLRWFDIERNQRFIDALIARLETFWRLVETNTPPPVDGSFATAKTLLKMHPSDSGEEVYLPPDSLAWSTDIAEAKEAIAAAEAKKTLAENRLKASIGDATFGIMPNGKRWSWKTQDRKGYEVGPTTTRILREMKG